jgi:hypothetical protein
VTGLLDRPGVWRPCQPAVPLWRLHRRALTRRGHGRGGPLPDRPAHHPSLDARGRPGFRGRAPRLGLPVALDGAAPGLGRRQAVREQRRGWPQPHARWRTPPVYQPGAALGMPGIVPRARRQLCRALSVHGTLLSMPMTEPGSSCRQALGSRPKMCIMLSATRQVRRSASRSTLLSHMALVQSTPKGGALCHVNGLLQ